MCACFVICVCCVYTLISETVQCCCCYYCFVHLCICMCLCVCIDDNKREFYSSNTQLGCNMTIGSCSPSSSSLEVIPYSAPWSISSNVSCSWEYIMRDGMVVISYYFQIPCTHYFKIYIYVCVCIFFVQLTGLESFLMTFSIMVFSNS